MTDGADLDRLAELVGIEPFYHDIWGNRREIGPATKRDLVQAMGFPAGTPEEAADSLYRLRERAWRRMLTPVVLLGDDDRVEKCARPRLLLVHVEWPFAAECVTDCVGATLGDSRQERLRGKRAVDPRCVAEAVASDAAHDVSDAPVSEDGFPHRTGRG